VKPTPGLRLRHRVVPDNKKFASNEKNSAKDETTAAAGHLCNKGFWSTHRLNTASTYRTDRMTAIPPCAYFGTTFFAFSWSS